MNENIGLFRRVVLDPGDLDLPFLLGRYDGGLKRSCGRSPRNLDDAEKVLFDDKWR